MGTRVRHGRATLGGALAVAALAALVDRVGRRSGATDEEVAARLPGDAIVAAPMWRSTRAVTVRAEPADIWPWLAQMGFPRFRAGWYTPHRLDRLMWGITWRSADRIVERFQGIAVGQRIPDSPDGSVHFTVAVARPAVGPGPALDPPPAAAVLGGGLQLGLRRPARRGGVEPADHPRPRRLRAPVAPAPDVRVRAAGGGAGRLGERRGDAARHPAARGAGRRARHAMRSGTSRWARPS